MHAALWVSSGCITTSTLLFRFCASSSDMASYGSEETESFYTGFVCVIFSEARRQILPCARWMRHARTKDRSTLWLSKGKRDTAILSGRCRCTQLNRFKCFIRNIDPQLKVNLALERPDCRLLQPKSIVALILYWKKEERQGLHVNIFDLWLSYLSVSNYVSTPVQGASGSAGHAALSIAGQAGQQQANNRPTNNRPTNTPSESRHA